ncbi:MAG: hypothetical protein DRG78_00335 [Epsilonproteobacteria bacterium]|nr:MAG: hypothetical protein DRG78_00335 [Campylobacterota bacterium]
MTDIISSDNTTMTFEQFSKIYEKDHLELIKEDPSQIKYLLSCSEKVKLLAVRKDPTSIKFIKEQSRRVINAASNSEIDIFLYIINPTEKDCVKAIKRDDWNIKYVKDPSEKVQLIAVKRVFLIEFINLPFDSVARIILNYDKKYNTTHSKYVKLNDRLKQETINELKLMRC